MNQQSRWISNLQTTICELIPSVHGVVAIVIKLVDLKKKKKSSIGRHANKKSKCNR